MSEDRDSGGGLFGSIWGGLKEGAGGLWEGAKQTVGVGKGFVEGAVETVGGVVLVGRSVASCVDPITRIIDRGAQARCNEFTSGLVDLGAAFSENPVDTVYFTFLEPIYEDWQAGNYGEAIGRGLFEAVTIVAGGAAARSGRAGRASTVLDDVVRTPVDEIVRSPADEIIRSKPGATKPGGAAFVENPKETPYYLFLEPIYTDWQAGNYGEAIGGSLFEAVIIVADGAAARGGRAGRPARLIDDVIRTPVDDVLSTPVDEVVRTPIDEVTGVRPGTALPKPKDLDPKLEVYVENLSRERSIRRGLGPERPQMR